MKICVNLKADICTQTMIPSLIERNITKMSFDILPYNVLLHNHDSQESYILEKLVHETTTLKVLHLEKMDAATDEFHCSIIKRDLLNLKEVWLNTYVNCSTALIHNFMSRCRNLQSLTLVVECSTNSPFHHYFDHIKIIVSGLNTLRHLTIYQESYPHCYLIGYLSGCLPLDHPPQQLTSWNKRRKTSENSEQGSNDGLGNLTTLKFGAVCSHYNLAHEDISYLANMKNLRILSLQGLNDTVYVKCLSQVDLKITHLELDSVDLGDEALNYIIESQFPLQTLSIVLWRITDEGIKQLVRGDKQIEKLILCRCWKITDAALGFLCEMSSLKYLEITKDITAITQKAKDKMRRMRKDVKLNECNGFHIELFS